MVSVLHANFISFRVGFVLSCFQKSNFSCSLSWRERYSREIALTCQIHLETKLNSYGKGQALGKNTLFHPLWCTGSGKVKSRGADGARFESC